MLSPDKHFSSLKYVRVTDLCQPTEVVIPTQTKEMSFMYVCKKCNLYYKKSPLREGKIYKILKIHNTKIIIYPLTKRNKLNWPSFLWECNSYYGCNESLAPPAVQFDPEFRVVPWVEQNAVSIITCFASQIMVEGVKSGPTQEGDMAFDDVHLSDAQCPPHGHCDFESNMCSWSNVGNGVDQEDWLRGRGDSLNPNTGPSVDHTTNSSHGDYTYTTSACDI